MIKFFNPENKFWIFVAKIADVCIMSMLWVLCSLPVITIGASTAAFYDFTLHQVRDEEGGIWKSFFTSFRANFKRATLAWLLELAAVALLAADLFAAWSMYLSTGLPGLLFLSLGVCAALMLLSCAQYVYAHIARFGFPLKKTLADCFIMAMGNLPVTITLLLILAAVCAAIYYMSGLFFFWIGLGIFFGSYFLTGVFGRYTGEGPTAEQLRAEKKAARARRRNFF